MSGNTVAEVIAAAGTAVSDHEQGCLLEVYQTVGRFMFSVRMIRRAVGLDHHCHRT